MGKIDTVIKVGQTISKNAPKIGKAIGKYAPGVASGIITAVKVTPEIITSIEKSNDTINKTKSNKKIVPELYGKEIFVSVEDGINILEERGFKVNKNIVDPNVKYRDCKPQQIIKTKPKSKSKEDIGELIHIQYITNETIEESKRLFEEQEKERINKKIERRLKLNQQKEVTQKKIKDTVLKFTKKENDITDENNDENFVDVNYVDVQQDKNDI